MKVVEVKTKEDRKDFLEIAIKLYKGVPNWIRPLDHDIEDVFDPSKNKFFRHGEACRWLLKSDEGKVIGRVAAFINHKTSKTFDQPTGGMGFFECINDKKAAFMLFDTCKEWLQERGMEAMDGPINFGDRDKWWGLLIEGWTEPNYGMPFHHAYYQSLFESYGFKLYFNQLTYARKVKIGGLLPKVIEKADRIFANPDYRFGSLKIKELDKYAEYFRSIYNKAWVKHKGVGEMSEAQAKSIMKRLKPVIDEKILLFGFYKDEPVAFFLILPELNQIFKHINGKLNWLGKLIFLYHKLLKTNKKMFGVGFGVVPEHQGKGVEAAIVVHLTRYAWNDKFQYEDFEMNWIGDFNPKMMRVAEDVGGKIVKIHRTYRINFDPNKPVERAPMID